MGDLFGSWVVGTPKRQEKKQPTTEKKHPKQKETEALYETDQYDKDFILKQCINIKSQKKENGKVTANLI